MTRPALYWTVQFYNAQLNVMRVTRLTDKRVYGSIDGISTHCPPSAVFGVYDTAEGATAAMRKIHRIWKDATERVHSLNRKIEQLQQSRDRNVVSALERLNNAS